MLPEKRFVRVTLDIECYDDFDVENTNWDKVLELQENELIQYYNDLNQYYWMNPERAELQQSIIDDSTFSEESESEYGSCSEEEYYFD